MSYTFARTSLRDLWEVGRKLKTQNQELKTGVVGWAWALTFDDVAAGDDAFFAFFPNLQETFFGDFEEGPGHQPP